MCREWAEDFRVFLRDMGTRPPGCSLDRIDNDGNYEPDNCRWANRSTQAKNQSGHRKIEVNGQLVLVSEAARLTGIKHATLRYRVAHGLPPLKPIGQCHSP